MLRKRDVGSFRRIVNSYDGFGAVGAATALAFGGASLLLDAVPAAVLGLAVYALILLAVRQLGLSDAWQYVRALH